MTTASLVVPSQIPWSDLKQEHLEETLYWLLDEIGLRNLTWRRGGKTTNAPDGGRDLEGTLEVATPVGEFKTERWWVEAKGREDTVEKTHVFKSIHSAAMRNELDVVVIATNTQFSNPTHDEVKAWQEAHPRPTVWLWQSEHLERLLTRYPSVVGRLFSAALSSQGRLEFATARFRRHAQYASGKDLDLFWREKAALTWTADALIAVVASEIANGDLELHPWLGTMTDDVEPLIIYAIENLLAMAVRAERFGSSSEPVVEAVGYLLLAAARSHGSNKVLDAIHRSWSEKDDDVPDLAVLKSNVLLPVIQTLQWELSDVCSQDCERVIVPVRALTEKRIEGYWRRFVYQNGRKSKPNEIVIIQRLETPCRAGLQLDRDRGCPLVSDPDVEDLPAYETIINDVVRTAQSKQVPVTSPASPSPASGRVRAKRRRRTTS
jgi:hypothetical protein